MLHVIQSPEYVEHSRKRYNGCNNADKRMGLGVSGVSECIPRRFSALPPPQ